MSEVDKLALKILHAFFLFGAGHLITQEILLLALVLCLIMLITFAHLNGQLFEMNNVNALGYQALADD